MCERERPGVFAGGVVVLREHGRVHILAKRKTNALKVQWNGEGEIG
jgi:hypothetical protein